MTPDRDTGSDPDPTDLLPQVGPDAEVTRVINLPGTVLPGPPRTRRDTPPQALRLRFPDDAVVHVEPGVRIRLGRDPQLCPAVTFLAAHDNLSRIHATVVVESDGSAWITDEGSTNGTFVHGYRLAPEQRAVLRPGDTVRLAADVTVDVLL
jgi:pSer/pThr/pTyr-binding forkhead associated (FHA) protein